METHKLVSRDEWLVARKALLADEKALSKARDRVAKQRRELPWVKVEKEYVFDTPDGRQTLAQLLDGRSQLIVYHFMFGPGWKEGCPGCSFVADHIDGANLHVAHHDVTLLAVSRAPRGEFEPFKKRMGWHFKWVSSAGSDFNFDYHVSASEAEKAVGKMNYNYETIDSATDELPGISVFTKDDAGQVFHAYSTYARGVDILIGAYNYLDMAPKGRNENTIMDWMKHHDRYETAAPDSCCHQKSA
jgi:predicted dithiol-disulfide oxidoreductase (DUF899 family)